MRPSGASPGGAGPGPRVGVSTHVLDTVTGEPASGIVVRLEAVGAGPASAGELARATTDADGRVGGFRTGRLAAGDYRLPAGDYRLVFETGPYLAAVHGEAASGSAPFYPEVVVTFTADGARPRYHVPLLLGPYSYTTYRGS